MVVEAERRSTDGGAGDLQRRIAPEEKLSPANEDVLDVGDHVDFDGDGRLWRRAADRDLCLFFSGVVQL